MLNGGQISWNYLVDSILDTYWLTNDNVLMTLILSGLHRKWSMVDRYHVSIWWTASWTLISGQIAKDGFFWYHKVDSNHSVDYSMWTGTEISNWRGCNVQILRVEYDFLESLGDNSPIVCNPKLGWRRKTVKITVLLKTYFFLSYLTAIFKPTTFLEPVFQPAKISLWMWNRGDAIMLLNTTTCNKF